MEAAPSGGFLIPNSHRTAVRLISIVVILAEVSTGRRNTLVFGRRWSDQNEVSSPKAAGAAIATKVGFVRSAWL
jgi:hypothetical protein